MKWFFESRTTCSVSRSLFKYWYFLSIIIVISSLPQMRRIWVWNNTIVHKSNICHLNIQLLTFFLLKVRPTLSQSHKFFTNSLFRHRSQLAGFLKSCLPISPPDATGFPQQQKQAFSSVWTDFNILNNTTTLLLLLQLIETAGHALSC